MGEESEDERLGVGGEKRLKMKDWGGGERRLKMKDGGGG